MVHPCFGAYTLPFHRNTLVRDWQADHSSPDAQYAGDILAADPGRTMQMAVRLQF